MDKQTAIELIKIASPYIIAILGILSPLFTTKYLNSEDFRKYKKQRNFDKNIEIYSVLITELREIKRICEYIVQMAEYYEPKNFSKEYEKIFHEKDDNKEILKDVVEITIKYDDTIRKSQNKIKEVIDENFVFLHNDIIKKISGIVEEYDSPLHIFDWAIPVMKMRKDNFKINLENIKDVYIGSSMMFKELISKTNDIIVKLKNEITGDN